MMAIRFAYPVFDSFENDKNNIASILITAIYWRNLFTNIIPENPRGYICVLQNSYNQTHQIDGATEVTILGERDLHDTHYNHLVQVPDVNQFVQQRSRPSTLSYTTVSLNQECGRYTLHIYPSKVTEDEYVSRKPIVYSMVIIGSMLLTTVVLLLLDRTIAWTSLTKVRVFLCLSRSLESYWVGPLLWMIVMTVGYRIFPVRDFSSS